MSSKTRRIRCVMDGTDWLYELGSASDGNSLYPNRKCLERESKHDLAECGIAVVEVRFVRWIRKPTI